jgi:hypothetical protein
MITVYIIFCLNPIVEGKISQLCIQCVVVGGCFGVVCIAGAGSGPTSYNIPNVPGRALLQNALLGYSYTDSIFHRKVYFLATNANNFKISSVQFPGSSELCPELVNLVYDQHKEDELRKGLSIGVDMLPGGVWLKKHILNHNIARPILTEEILQKLHQEFPEGVPLEILMTYSLKEGLANGLIAVKSDKVALTTPLSKSGFLNPVETVEPRIFNKDGTIKGKEFDIDKHDVSTLLPPDTPVVKSEPKTNFKK